MLVAELVRRKGKHVITIAPGTSVRELVAMLAEHRIGAVVVSSDGGTVEGIVSERDVVRALAEHGAQALEDQVSAVMTTEVHTCPLDAHVEALMQVMTEQRVRHIPVVDRGALQGIVSIGDVVKSRMVELELERDSLQGYISSGG